MNKQIKIGSTMFTTPFRSEGYWVVDAKGKNYCECIDATIAKITAAVLNSKFV